MKSGIHDRVEISLDARGNKRSPVLRKDADGPRDAIKIDLCFLMLLHYRHANHNFPRKRSQTTRNLRFAAQFPSVETAKRFRDGNHGVHDEEGHAQREHQVEKERVGGLRWIFSSSDIFPQFRIGQSNVGRTILNACGGICCEME